MTNSHSAHDVLESITSYAIGVLAIAFDAMLANAPTIMTIGGLVLLVMRLYVDGVRAWKTYKGDKDG